MKRLSEKIRGRMRKDRPWTTINLRVPEDLIDDLKEMAPYRGFGRYESLQRAYIGQGMRKDEARMESPQVRAVMDILKRHGVAEEVIAEALAAMFQSNPWFGLDEAAVR